MISEKPRAALDREFLTLLRLALRALAILFPFIAITEAFGIGESASLEALIYDIVLSLIFIALALWFGRFPPAPQWGHPIAFGLAVLCQSSSLLTLYNQQDMSQTGNVSVILAAVGFLFLSTRWFVAFVVLALGSWAWVTRMAFDPPVSLLGAQIIYPATVAASVIHITRVQTTLRLQRLMDRNEAQRTELSEALRSAEREIAERRRMEISLVSRVELERLISNASKRFVNISSEDLDEAIHETMKEIGRATGVDRAYVIAFDPKHKQFSRTHEWCAEGIQPLIDELQNLPINDFPWILQQIQAHRVVHIPRIAELPPEASAEKTELERQGVLSLLGLALQTPTTSFGFLGFDSVRSEKAWSEDVITLLGLLAEIIVGVHERIAAEAAMTASEERYRLLADNSQDVIWTMDAKFRSTYVTPSLEQLLGYSWDDLKSLKSPWVAMDAESIDHLTSQSIEATSDLLKRLVSGETLELKLIHKDGHRVWTETSAKVLRDHAGSVIGFQGITRDIDARKRIEEEKAGLEDRLLQSQKMEAIGTLAGGIAHDFNNLLTGILGYSNLLKLENAPGTETYEAADVIERAAERAAQLTRQLLGFARKGKFQNSRIDVNDMIQEVITLLTRTINKNIEMKARLDAQESLVNGDPTQIQQVILNIAVNARDAMPDGGQLLFETDPAEFGETDPALPAGLKPGKYLRIRISDSGSGIPEEIRRRIFEPFFTTKDPGKGTGMGLATAYGIVKNHNGLIQVDSEEGEGTVFEILLPSFHAIDRIDESSSDLALPSPTSAHIMLLDDEALVCNIASAMLERIGYEITTFTDPDTAILSVKKDPTIYELVILDVMMPKKDGLACLRAIREINPKQRILLSSGFEQGGLVETALAEGALGFIQKPYKLEILGEAVSKALTKKVR